MDLIVSPDGTIRAVYAEAIDLGVLGHHVISRASHVEPTDSVRFPAISPPKANKVVPFFVSFHRGATQSGNLCLISIERGGSLRASKRGPLLI
jgi:hypothetical protein